MKSLFTFFLAILTVSAFAASNDSNNYSVVKHSQPTFTTLDDSTGIAIMTEGVGFVSNNAGIALWKTEAGVIVAVGVKDANEDLKGIIISSNGELMKIEASHIIIQRKAFISHAQADNELLSGEEYYLIGDRIVYRKP